MRTTAGDPRALSTGEITHIAGSGARGTSDGSALDATFNWPNGIAATGEGKIFVNDLNAGAENESGGTSLSTGSVRLLSLPSLTEVLIGIFESQGGEAMVAAFHDCRADPATAGMLDEAEGKRLGLRHAAVLARSSHYDLSAQRGGVSRLLPCPQCPR